MSIAAEPKHVDCKLGSWNFYCHTPRGKIQQQRCASSRTTNHQAGPSMPDSSHRRPSLQLLHTAFVNSGPEALQYTKWW